MLLPEILVNSVHLISRYRAALYSNIDIRVVVANSGDSNRSSTIHAVAARAMAENAGHCA